MSVSFDERQLSVSGDFNVRLFPFETTLLSSNFIDTQSHNQATSELRYFSIRQL